MTPASPSPSPSSAELLDGLRRVLGAVEVVDLVRLSGGASRETWRFTADGRPLILQTQRAGDERDMGIEADVVRAAEAAGMPVPSLIASSNRPDELGSSYMVLTAIDGETIARKILRDDEFSGARSSLTTDLANALALLHAIPTTAVEGLVEIDQIGHYRAALEALQQPHPAFELAFRWLEQHRPVSSARSIVHGDFRLGNVIVGSDGLRAVIDWELAHIGDPMEDLGWMCVKAWRFGSRHPVAGVGEYDELFTAYEQAGGARVDPTSVRWWEVLGTLKWGIMCILQTTAHLSGASRSHELAAIGRRVCENEHDLFLALEGRW
jgi:aminoglycoside phosphotransferase (APT) family kinase protein